MQPLDGSNIIDTLPLGPPGPQGDQGDRGYPGPQGIQGIPGSIGAVGLSTYSGPTTPDSSFGRDGESFIVPQTGDYFRKTGGSWQLVGNLRGPSPGNEVDGVRIRFMNPDGSWGDYINLGEAGPESFSKPVPWAAEVYYTASAPRATVVYAGETYVATTSHASTSTFDATKWQKIAAKGADGTTPGTATVYDLNLLYGS